MDVNRREALSLVGLGAGTAMVAGCQLEPTADYRPGSLAAWASTDTAVRPSLCTLCPGGCGLMLRVRGDDVVGVAGNPVHPVNHGGLCPRAFSWTRLVHHPERITGPRTRAGHGTAPVPVSWDDGVTHLAGTIGRLRQDGTPHRLVVIGEPGRGLRPRLWRRFAAAVGTPNHIAAHGPAFPDASLDPGPARDGRSQQAAPDLANARLIVSFANDFLDDGAAPVAMARAWSAFRGRPGEPGRLVHIGPRYSRTAAKSDLHVPLALGGEGWLALGIAHVLVRERRIDRDFIDRFAAGYRGQMGYEHLVGAEIDLAMIETATGVPAATIQAIARDLATRQPAVVLAPEVDPLAPIAPADVAAIRTLNALTGAIGVTGGLVVGPPAPFDLPAADAPDRVAASGLARPPLVAPHQPDPWPELIAAFEGDGPYPVEAVVLAGDGPPPGHPLREAFVAALARVPLVASLSAFATPAAAAADLVLPDDLAPERWVEDTLDHLAGFTAVALARPAVPRRHRTRNAADVAIALARAIGGPVAKALPWQRFDDLLFDAGFGLFDAGRGHIVADAATEALHAGFRQQGTRAPEFHDYGRFWDNLVARGAWWEPSDGAPGPVAVLGGPGRRYDLDPARLGLSRTPPQFCWGDRHCPSAGSVPLPAGPPMFLSSLGGGVAFAADLPDRPPSLRLRRFRPVSQPAGPAPTVPWLDEQPAADIRSGWAGWVELNTATAARHGIVDGDLVRLETVNGAATLPAKLRRGGDPRVVHVPQLANRRFDPAALFGTGAGACDRLGTICVRIGKV